MADLNGVDPNLTLRIVESVYTKLITFAGAVAWFTANSIKLNRHDKLLYDREEQVKVTMKSDCLRNHDRLENKMDLLTGKTEEGMIKLHERIDELPQKIKDLLK